MKEINRIWGTGRQIGCELIKKSKEILPERSFDILYQHLNGQKYTDIAEIHDISCSRVVHILLESKLEVLEQYLEWRHL